MPIGSIGNSVRSVVWKNKEEDKGTDFQVGSEDSETRPMKKTLGKESECGRGADTMVKKTRRVRMRNDRIWKMNSVAEASNKFREKSYIGMNM